MAVHVVEVLAIYEPAGVAVTNPRRNRRNQDYDEAVTRSGQVAHYQPGGQPLPADEEYLRKFGDTDGYSRYGFGWQGRQWVVVAQDAQTLGQAIADRLATSNLKPGSKVQVFEHLADEGNAYATGALLFERTW